jgi:DNA primase
MAEEWDGRGWSDKSGVRSKRSIRDIKREYPITRVLDMLTSGRFKLPLHSDGGWVSVRCPFHGDSQASASVNVGRGRFNCHGCNVSGDALDIVQEVKGLGTVQEARDWIISNS